MQTQRAPCAYQYGSIIPLFALLLGVLLMLGFFAISIGIAANSKSQLMYAASQAARAGLDEFHAVDGTTAVKAQSAIDRATRFFQQNARLLGYLGSVRVDPGRIALENDRADDVRAGTLRFGSWFTEPANCGAGGCVDVCNGNYPCFVPAPMAAAPSAINAAQVAVSLDANNSFDVILGGLFGRSPFRTDVVATVVNQPRCYEILIDASNSVVGDNYDMDIAKVVPSSVHPRWGGDFASYSFSRSARAFGDYLYEHKIRGVTSTAHPPGHPSYPEPEDCSETSPNNPLTDPNSDWAQFAREYELAYGVQPSPAAAGISSFIWCAMRTFRETRTDDSALHFTSDYRPIVPDFGGGPAEEHWVDAYRADSGRGPEPLRTILLAVHNLVKSAMNNGYGSDYIMLRTFGANIRPAVAGLYGREDFPYLLQVTNPELGPIVRPDASEEQAVYPNFATLGVLPNEDAPFTNLLLGMYQAIEDLTRDPISGPPSPGMYSCPANAVKRIIVASDFLLNCKDQDDFNVTTNPANSCPYTGGGVPINYCFRRIPVGSGAVYCSATHSGWAWLDLYTVAGAVHPGGPNPYTGQPWEWSTRLFSGNPTYLSNALATGGISVLTIMAGNRVGPNWKNKVNPNAGANEYQWWSYDDWAARQNVDPVNPPSLNALSGSGPLSIVDGGGQSSSAWNRMTAGLTGTPSDGANYRPFTAPNRVAAWLALVSGGSFCPLRPIDTRPNHCTPDDKLHPGDPTRLIHCDQISSSCRSYPGVTNCNTNPHLCSEYFADKCESVASTVQNCISSFTAPPLALVENVNP